MLGGGKVRLLRDVLVSYHSWWWQRSIAARVSRLGLGFGRSQRLSESLTASPCQAIPEKTATRKEGRMVTCGKNEEYNINDSKTE